MCCYLTALSQTEETESYFWSSLNQKLWLSNKNSPAGDRDCVAKHVIKKKKKKGRKKQTVKMNWDHPVIGQRGLPAVLLVFLKATAFAALTFCCKTLYTKISNCRANHSQESDPLFRRDLSPLNILFYWCYEKKLEIHKESTVALVEMQALYKELWEVLPTCRHLCLGGIRPSCKVNCFTAVLQGRHLARQWQISAL